jgi:hypothetical protein
MFKLFIGTALLYLPLAVPCGMLCFIVTRWSLRRKNRIMRRILNTGILFSFMISAAGIVYGILRFSGILIFAKDNTVSYNWFDASYRDEGFKYIYSCGVLFLSLVIAGLSQRSSQSNKSMFET